MIKTIELGNVEDVGDITISDYTDFIGEIDGISYPYVELEHDEGYICGRCSGPCDRDRPPSTEVKIVVWEQGNDTPL